MTPNIDPDVRVTVSVIGVGGSQVPSYSPSEDGAERLRGKGLGPGFRDL